MNCVRGQEGSSPGSSTCTAAPAKGKPPLSPTCKRVCVASFEAPWKKKKRNMSFVYFTMTCEDRLVDDMAAMAAFVASCARRKARRVSTAGLSA